MNGPNSAADVAVSDTNREQRTLRTKYEHNYDVFKKHDNFADDLLTSQINVGPLLSSSRGRNFDAVNIAGVIALFLHEINQIHYL